jgi:hypothetical protein
VIKALFFPPFRAYLFTEKAKKILVQPHRPDLIKSQIFLLFPANTKLSPAKKNKRTHTRREKQSER